MSDKGNEYCWRVFQNNFIKRACIDMSHAAKMY